MELLPWAEQRYTRPVQGDTRIGGAQRRFPTTRWSRVLAAQGDSGARRCELERMAHETWKPLYVYARGRGLDPERAKDGVQSFFAKLVERDFPQGLDPAKGRLRSFLRTAFERHLAHAWEAEGALKRGAGAVPVELDEGEHAHAQAGAAEPGAALDREWAVGVLERAQGELKAEFDSGRRRGPWELVLPYLAGSPPPYAEHAAARGLREQALRSLVFRTRARFAVLVRAQIAATTEDEAEIERELDDLLDALRA